MGLKQYQKNTIKTIEEFFAEYKSAQIAVAKLREVSPEHAVTIASQDFSRAIFSSIKPSINYFSYSNPEGQYYPNLTIKAPTGAGKTLLAIETINSYFDKLLEGKKTGLVVWMVHRETIFNQTIHRLRDKNDFYRQTLEFYFGNNVLIKTKGDSITQNELENNIVILFIMLQSASRKNKENLKIFKDNGRYINSIFPQDYEYAKHKELLEKMPYLDKFADSQSLQPQIKTSLGNLIRICKPLIIVDEYHRFFSKLGIELLDSLNPDTIIGFTATPENIGSTRSSPFEAKNNILAHITGGELHDEDMIKYPINLNEPPTDYSWKQLIKDIYVKRNELEITAQNNENNNGSYIRPISLIQVELTGADQQEKDGVHTEDVKKYLVSLGVAPDQIAVKTSQTDDLKQYDLLSNDCEIRYVITKYAIAEGWDCPFAYILGIIPNTSTNKGLTQLVGRVLRQPYQTKIDKTGSHDLDECYIYYLAGDTEKTLQQIKEGLKTEGLEDLAINQLGGDGNIKVVTSGTNRTMTKIRKDVVSKHNGSLYLPMFYHKTQKRKFSYEMDILANIDWKDYTLPQDFYDTLSISFVAEHHRNQIKIDLNEETQEFERVKNSDGVVFYISQDRIDQSELLRAIYSIIENPFVANKLASQIITKLSESPDLKKGFDTNGTLTINEIKKHLEDSRDTLARQAFDDLVSSDSLSLVFGTTQEGAFRFRDSVIGVQEIGDDKYLYERYDFDKLNNLENKVKTTLLNHNQKLLWWYRNPDRDTNQQTNFHIQGYRKYKIRPDFVASKINPSTKELEMVYILESKGLMLDGNPDTKYKQYMFEVLNKLVSEGKTQLIDTAETGIIGDINQHIQAHFIQQDKESTTINPLFNN